MIYLVFPPSGPLREEHTIGRATIQQMHEWVGGYIEISYWIDPIYPSLVAIVNEEGRLIGLPQNSHFPRFAGPVVLARVNGEELDGLTGPQLDRWRKLAEAGIVA